MHEGIIKMNPSFTPERILLIKEFNEAYNRQLERLVDDIYQKSKNVDIYHFFEIIFDEVKKRCKYDWENYSIYKTLENRVANNKVDIYFTTRSGSIKKIDQLENTKQAALLYGKSYCFGFQQLVVDVFELLKTKYGKTIEYVCTNNSFHSWNTVKIDGIWYKFDVSGVFGDDYLNNFRRITTTDKFDITAIKSKFPDENIFTNENDFSGEGVLRLRSSGTYTPKSTEVLKMRPSETYRPKSTEVLKMRPSETYRPKSTEVLKMGPSETYRPKSTEVLKMGPRSKFTRWISNLKINNFPSYGKLKVKRSNRMTILINETGKRK